VNSEDYGIFVGQFGRRDSGSRLAADFNGDGSVDIVDFAALRANLGNTFSTAAQVATAASQPPKRYATERIQYPAQAPSTRETPDLLAGSARAKSVEGSLLAVSLSKGSNGLVQSAGRYVPKLQSAAVSGSTTALYRAAAAENEMRNGSYRPLAISSQLEANPLGDPLADILAESPLANI